MTTVFRTVSVLSRVAGVLLPPLATLTILARADRLDEFGEDFVALMVTAGIIGLVAGLVLRWWGAGCLVPVLIIAMVTIVYIGDALHGGLCEGYGACDPIPLSGFLFFFVGPFLIPAALGTLAGTWIGKTIHRYVIRFSSANSRETGTGTRG